MLSTRQLRTLELESSPITTGAPHISAASGMVVVGPWLYVVADDELHLGVFDLSGKRGGTLLRLFDGQLPADPRERKAAKPDLETLVLLPPFAAHPHGALLALGSGSRPNRRTGVSLALDASGLVTGNPRSFDLTPFYLPLQSDFPDLNIEGAVILGNELVLLQRGGKSRPQSALIHFPLAGLLRLIHATGSADKTLLKGEAHLVDLGQVEGVALGFTDGASLPDGRIVFSAVAENTADSYVDGPCVGAAVGVIGRNGQVQSIHRLQRAEKVEGIHAMPRAGRVEMMLVTDADDATVAARLLAATISLR